MTLQNLAQLRHAPQSLFERGAATSGLGPRGGLGGVWPRPRNSHKVWVRGWASRPPTTPGTRLLARRRGGGQVVGLGWRDGSTDSQSARARSRAPRIPGGRKAGIVASVKRHRIEVAFDWPRP